MNIGDRLKKLRLEKGLTIREVAKIFNISKSTVSDYERGRTTPNYELLIKMADYFNVTTDYLLGLTDERNIYKTVPKEVPKILRELGTKYIGFAKDLKDAELTEEEIKDMIEYMKKV
jgi:transcriptional regulator with XRE-family HTH domain